MSNNFKLSILICSIDERQQKLHRLLDALEEQNKYRNLVQVVVFQDNRQTSIGKKRNELVNSANGEYSCFIDDDDNISKSYIDDILKALYNNGEATHCSLIGEYIKDGKLDRKFEHSNKFKEWKTTKELYERTPNHLNAVKTDILKKYPFPEINHGEDRKQSDSMAHELTNQAQVQNTLYYYLFDSKK